jgi:hypothetical protein
MSSCFLKEVGQLMPSPFPGVDPYLEHPEIWFGVHLLLIAAIAEQLTPQLRPKYTVSVEVRLYETSGEEALLVGIPDAAQLTISRSTTHQTQYTLWNQRMPYML